MAAPTVLVVLAEGFEEIEAMTPVDLLRRAGAQVTLASVDEGIHVVGRSGIVIHADTTLSAQGANEFDCLVLPGGPGVKHLRADKGVIEAVRRQNRRGGWIAAICAAPVVLNDAGILDGRQFTAHFSVSGELPAARLEDRVVEDGRLITSRGAGTALDFGLRLVERLFSAEKSGEVARSICA